MTRTASLLPTILLSAAALLSTSSAVQAAPLLSITDVDGDPTSVQIAPGGSFTIGVTLAADVPFNGLSFFLTASTSDRFAITGRTTAALNPLEDAISGTATVTAAPLAPSSVDLGYSNNPVSVNELAGTYAVASYTIASSTLLGPGTFTLQTTDGALANAAADEFGIAPSALYTVTVVPEPAIASVMLAPLALLMRAQRRRGGR